VSEKPLQAVILAGGLGTRLRPLTEKIPKPMVEVAGMPFLFWQLQDLKAQGYGEVLLLVAYLGEQIEKYFGRGDSLGLNLKYVYETEPLGTGGALKNALPMLESEFILLNGDSFLKAPLAEMTASFHLGSFEAMVSVYDNKIPVPVIPNLKTKAQKVLEYEKDAGIARGFDKIDSGVYVLNRLLVEAQTSVRFMLADLWAPLIKTGRMGAFDVQERFYDIGTVERLKEFEEKVRDYFPHPISC
jgi:MurNAc alpha-1-phosphate uridylyltransferase